MSWKDLLEIHLDILINNTKIAKGEVVMIGERFGVRFGEIVDPEKRMESFNVINLNDEKCILNS